MTIRRTNPRKQGEIGLGRAIAWFTSQGYAVSIPLTDSRPYDLAVDDGERIQTVQVKTTTRRKPSGNFCVALTTSGGNRSWNGTPRYLNRDRVDLLFVATDHDDDYVIPVAVIDARREVTLDHRFRRYRVRPRAGEVRQLRLFEPRP
jgi:PD-(D/E)XK nuclease superfamily protein